MTTAVAKTEDTESALIARALSALSRCNWEVGECAAQWTKRFARGRTDADFAALVGLSPDQVYQRRRVWETFGDVSESYSLLKWSHFYAALNWDDAAECLQWAQDVQAGVAEMRAWRRAQHGEDLSEASSDESMGLGPIELTLTNESAPFDAGSVRMGASEGMQSAALAAGGAESSSNSSAPYAPFREDAATPPARESAERQEPTTEQLVKRMTSAVERCVGAMNPQFARQFGKLPEKVRKRFLKAVEQLTEKAGELDE
ncbi:MAG: hypothetical protein JSS49_19150 [Planctomycetes bacterium]|nr:hypothetical protein [Planctomycetota bacterium]